jgi:hypothetical protein
MPLDHITDHAERAIARLPAQFRLPRIESFVRALCSEVQVLEDVFWDLYTLRRIDVAVGAQLDTLGRIVGQLRGGLDDTSYRVRIRVRIILNKASGTPNDVLRIFALLVGAQVRVLREEFPAAFTLRIVEALPIPVDDAAAILQAAKPVGVRALLEWVECADGEALHFDSGPGLDTGRLGGLRER